LTIPEPDTILEKLTNIHEKCRENRDISENKLKRYFHKSGILEELGYEEEDIHVEETVKGQKRTDIHVTDDYGNVRAVIEFKKPNVRNLREHFNQLWKRYMKPLKAKYGFLYNGLELFFFRRIGDNYEEIFIKNVADIDKSDLSKVISHVRKPTPDLSDIREVEEYLEKHKESFEKLNLKDQASREHFYNDFRLKKDSAFGRLLINTVKLFKETYEKENYVFLVSAYDFWKISYAKKPEEVPKNWKPIMKKCDLSNQEEDLYKFMFCLETTYALFTRLVLAKSAEDYEFTGIEFVGFLEREIRRAEFRNEIPLSAWPIIVEDLIKNMRTKLVSSVFEEDIFYWWTEALREQEFEDLGSWHKGEITLKMDSFGEMIRELLLTISKYDFSEIKGDPLGILYQRYFDKETRKALGEFYTPQEVVEYILDTVGYKGRKVLDKRLLDPACGSGTFLVTALKRYLKASEDIAEERGWDWVLDNLCNHYRIVGFDIHPFATIMAQIQFMLVLLPYYKKAINDNKYFVLNRIPIFRTDSLKYESSGEDSQVTLKEYEEGKKKVSMDIELPIRGENNEFFESNFEMPYVKTARIETDLNNNEQYFGTLQALFDVVKKQSYALEDSNSDLNFDKTTFERALKEHYLSGKDWSQLSEFFEPFANDLLQKIHKLQTQFEDGRLVKSIEDIFLAALLKEQDYEYVVGNPPWGGLLLGERGALPTTEMRSLFRQEYKTAYGKFDIYVLFIERGIEWLKPGGSLSYITQNRFMKRQYGKKTRELLLKNTKIDLIVDFGDTDIFKDATNYPAIFKANKTKTNSGSTLSYVEVNAEAENLSSSEILNRIVKEEDSKFISLYSINQKELTVESWSPAKILGKEIVKKIKSSAEMTLKDLIGEKNLSQGCTLGGKNAEDIFLLSEKETQELAIESKFIKRVLKGGDISRWNVPSPKRYLIYPYEIENDDFEPVDIKQYPKLYDYLSQYKKRLEERELDGKIFTDWGKKWFELWRPREPKILESKKIVTPRLSQENAFTYEENKAFLLDSAVGLRYSPSDEEIKYVLSLLNSSLIQFYINSESTFVQDRYYNYSQEVIYSIPIVTYENVEKSTRNRLVKLVNKIENISSLEKSVEKFPEDYMSSEESNYKVQKMKSVHSSISPSIQKTQDDMYGVIIGKRSKEKPIVVDTEEKARFVKLALEGDSVKKNEKIEVLVPKSNSEVKQILQEYEEDKEKLEEMPTMEELEEEINEIVYELYGLDDDDIEVIEEFLEKF